MQIFVLGGNSAHNKAWSHKLGDALVNLGDVSVHDYAHWDNPESEGVDIDSELAAIEAKLAKSGDYIIVAKSIGAVLTALGIGEGSFTPKLCVLMGVPLRMIERHRITYTEALAKATCPLVFIQNSSDPLGSYEEVKTYLEQGSLPEYSVIELAGDTHDYLDFTKLIEIVAKNLPS